VGCGCTCGGGGGGEMRWWLQAAAERRRWETRARERWGFRPDAWMGLFILSPPGDLRPISRFDCSFFLDLSSIFCYPVWFLNLFFSLSVPFKAAKGNH
jgi:hypothetical protein